MYINCKGELIDLSRPKVMGILNLTPDSFYDGGKYNNEASILNQVQKMVGEGADFIDLGAYSSRPNAKNISEEEEQKRLIAPLRAILKEFPETRISVDTFRSRIAREAVKYGACMVNDISGGELDPEMFRTIAELQVPYVLMHMKGSPQTMQQHTSYTNLVKEMIFYFSEKIFELRQMGVNDLILDPGFGFSKNLLQNYELLGKLDLLETLNLPILTGISRKSMLYRLLDIKPENALNATTVANTIALLKGARILRVHDIKEAVEAIEITQKMKDSQVSP
ncbi:dihydropteroate synthase [Lutimonas zeaxanthinifaciens]|uniref:dihydropteroate synthase n=1 Tax=Lutimonas zeaxanthinifaciens TaxID=3060215 RepID=UPI00265CD62D|nr:dihydropteroate synthase [Lutimonas sp. YSD2104]WKK66758.1 dihydropteroate synthase [Lutimonas sp. YSD2104]